MLLWHPCTGIAGGTAGKNTVASDRIADALRAAILDGSYLPGTRIRQEDVAARSGASRIPVREAFRLLASEGLVTLVANTGAWVTRLSLDECVETYLIRERLEPLLLRASLPNLDDAAIGRLGALTGAMVGAVGQRGGISPPRPGVSPVELRGRPAGGDIADHRANVEYHPALPARVH